MKNNVEIKKAFSIGIVSVSAYITCYYMRNLLGNAALSMYDDGFTKESVALLGSCYMIFYALGQLLNGIIGDRTKAKYMTSLGLALSGVSSILFAVISNLTLQAVFFCIMGFALSMLRGPLVKVISENTLPKYARICCVFLSFAGFLGPLISGFLAMIFDWQNVFIVAGISVIVIGCVVYFVYSSLENKGLIKPVNIKKEPIKLKNTLKVFKLENFKFYILISAVIEICVAAINAWIPTYMSEYLGLSNQNSQIVFQIIAIILSVTPFVALRVYSFFKHDEFKMMFVCYLMSALFFVSLVFIKSPMLNISMFIVARIFAGFSSALLWSIYIPNQGKSGMTSTVNGVLDFSGYIASAIFNFIFGLVATSLGWTSIILIWAGVVSVGCGAALIKKITSRKSDKLLPKE